MPYLTDIGQIRYVKQLKMFFAKYFNGQNKILHSHFDQVTGIILEAANKSNVPIRIAHSHSTNNSNGIFGKIYKRYLQSKINNNANVKLSCSTLASSWLYKNKSSSAIIINNSININKFIFNEINRKQIRQELNISDDTFLIGHVGRLTKPKNHDFLLKIFAKFLSQIPNAKLVLVGDGELKQDIISQIDSYGISSNVILLGNRTDVYKIYSALDLFVFPSLNEGFGIAVLEAQANGLKCICSTNVPPMSSILDNIKFINLTSPINLWIQEIAASQNSRRMDGLKSIEQVKAAGYDILDVTKQLTKLYENSHNNNS